MTLKAGTAVGDITPVVPAALFGYPHVDRVATGVHDPLLASVLWLQDGSDAVVLVALDVLLLEPPQARAIRRAVAERLSIEEARVFISCTHTHSGPVSARLLAWSEDRAVPPPDNEYLELVRDQVVAAAGRAAERAVPAEIAWTTADARGVGGNRHAPDGPTDPEAGVLVVREAGGGPLVAAALVYGMHPTVLHEDSRLVSSDFPHYARQHLRERFGERLVTLYHMAPSGNQSPRYFVRGQTFAEAERLGRRLGAAAVASIDRLRTCSRTSAPSLPAPLPQGERGAVKPLLSDVDFRQEVDLRGVLRSVELPARELPSVAEAQAILDSWRAEYQRLQQAGADRGAVRTAECAVFGAEGTRTLARLQAADVLAKALDDHRPIEVQAVRIGDGFLVGLPGELFVEYALEIKHRSRQRVFVVSLVNGELQGYVVTPEAAAQGCYESLTALFRPESGRLLVEAALDAVASLAACSG
jgi:hypothetical protein